MLSLDLICRNNLIYNSYSYILEAHFVNLYDVVGREVDEAVEGSTELFAGVFGHITEVFIVDAEVRQAAVET